MIVETILMLKTYETGMAKFIAGHFLSKDVLTIFFQHLR